MKKFFMYLPLAALLFAAGCDKDDDVEPYIIEIPEFVNLTTLDIENRISAAYTFMLSYRSKTNEEVGSISCTASTLKIEFPSIPANKYLCNVTNYFGNDCTISDPNARIGMISLVTVDCGIEYNMILGQSFDGDDTEDRYVEYFYADRDVVIDGIDNNTDIHREYDNVSLKKGWNRIACRCKFLPSGSSSIRMVYFMNIPTDTYWKLFRPFELFDGI